MFPTRGHLELFVGAIVLVVLLATAASRTVTLTDRSQHQALKTAGAHFVAGIEMLQAESRLDKHPTLNAVGYPTGRSGLLQDDADCEAIWRDTMRSSTASVVSRFVADSDGGGDRCEFQLVDPVLRILYWPLGASAATVAFGRDTIRITRGAHVHVEAGTASS
jgi:hypothetical protein